MRFYDAVQRNIFINEKSIHNFSRESLRENIGMTLQNI